MNKIYTHKYNKNITYLTIENVYFVLSFAFNWRINITGKFAKWTRQSKKEIFIYKPHTTTPLKKILKTAISNTG
jgi:hypothetical protein